jgi:membrane-associated phospholipid phosphatase
MRIVMGAVEATAFAGQPAAARPVRWMAVDWLAAAYTALTGGLIAVRHEMIRDPWILLGAHAGILLFMALLPPRGAAWEQPRPGESRVRFVAREVVRYLRYGYPLLLVIFFFEEVERTILAVWPTSGYWFEARLYAADRALFGVTPAIALAAWQSPWIDELMHFFYSCYYYILIGGSGAAWFIGYKRTGRAPGPGYSLAMTSVVAAFLCAFIWYPWLPARGPWENAELMAGLPPFEGFSFQRLIEVIIAGGAVSGGCFPSGHVAGSWGMTLGLWPYHRRTAAVFGFFAAGMSIACVYTRYHHAVDILAGLMAAVAGAAVARAVVRPKPPQRAVGRIDSA